jgi:hypothetical protein
MFRGTRELQNIIISGEQILMSKRVADSQLTKDNAHGSDSGSDSEQHASSREVAPKEVIAARKIVTVKRSAKVEESKISVEKASPAKDETTVTDTTPAAPVAAAGAPASLFAGLTGLIPKSSSQVPEPEKPTLGLFSGFGGSNTALPSLFSSEGNSNFSFAPLAAGGISFPSFGESPQEEEGSSSEQEGGSSPSSPSGAPQAMVDQAEDEELLFTNDCKLFKLEKQEEGKYRWTEKGIGFVRLIGSKTDKSKLRLVVRMKGVFRLMLNVGLVVSIAKIEKIGGKSIKFTAIDEEGGFADFRINLLSEDQQTKFVDTITTLEKSLESSFFKQPTE